MSNATIKQIESEIAVCESQLMSAIPARRAGEVRNRLQHLREQLVRQKQKGEPCQK